MNPTGKTFRILRSAFCILVAPAACKAATVYVSSNGLHEVNGVIWGTYVDDNGVSQNAYTNLQQAIDAAGNPGTIWVEDGFVCSTGIASTDEGNPNRIKCSGASNKLKTLRSRSGDWRTGAEIRGDAATRCFVGQYFTVIGFRFVGGTSTSSTAAQGGGGAYVTQYGGTFENCLFADCTATANGGGLARKNNVTSSPIRNCVFTNCVTTTGLGGAAHAPGGNFSDCLFIGNRASGTGWDKGNGGAISGAGNATAERCVFIDNHAYNKSAIDLATHAGGVGGAVSSVKTVTDCVFSNCTASALGGACAGSSGSNVTIVNCLAGRGGGGIRGGTWTGGSITGCVDTNAASGDQNGGAANDSATLTDFLIAGNSARCYGGGTVKCTLKNCVVVDNVASNPAAGSKSVTAGGGVYGGRAENCVIANNAARGPENKKGSQYYGEGGGASGATLVKCLVTNNVAWYRGGGAYGGSAQNSFIADNEAFAEGGGIAATTPVFNTLVARNTATKQAGVWTDSKATTVLVSSTVTANTNTVANQSAVYRAAITNSVVWGNLGDGATQTATRMGAAYSCFPEADGANGTTASDPKLTTVGEKEYVATAGRCRGKALLYDWMEDPDSVRSLDWYGDPRVYRSKPDMGWVSAFPPPAHSVIYVQ